MPSDMPHPEIAIAQRCTPPHLSCTQRVWGSQRCSKLFELHFTRARGPWAAGTAHPSHKDCRGGLLLYDERGRRV